jgi:hypothetical protein
VTGNWYEKGQVYTGLIQESCNDVFVCLDAMENYAYYIEYWYSGFTGVNNLLLSFFNGLLNQILSYTNLITDIEKADKAGNVTAIIYHTSRMIRITFDFEPILFTGGSLLTAAAA